MPQNGVDERALSRLGRMCSSTTLDDRALRIALLDELRRSVGFDAYAWLLTDPETEVGCSPVADVPCLDSLPRLIRLKYLTRVNRWTRMAGSVDTLRRVTDGEVERSLLWRELLADHDVDDVASLVFRDAFGCWGFLDLWRTGARGFDDRDVACLAAITAPVTLALRRCQAQTFAAPPLDHDRAGPAVLVLGPDLDVVGQTPGSEEYLRRLLPTGADTPPIPASAYNVGAQLLALESGVDDHPPLARFHLGQGLWLRCSAARIGNPPSATGDLAVTMEVATPTERTSVLALTCGLSPRESELVHLLASGADTRGAAQAMFVSENTIQDHLKSIFAKTGTNSRRALLGRAVGR